MSQTVSHHRALIYIMMLVSAADGKMSDLELGEIGEIVSKFPVFDDFDPDQLVYAAEECGEIMSGDEGFDTILSLITTSVPAKLIETAYAVAVEVAVADNHLSQEELRVLELLRHSLKLDRLYAGAIERSARARHMTL